MVTLRAGLLAAVLGLLVPWGTAARAAGEPIYSGSAAWKEVMKAPIAADPVSAMRWVGVLEDGGLAQQAQALQRVLVPRYLRQAAGEQPKPAKWTVGEAIEHADVPPATDDPHALAMLMTRALAYSLKPQPMTAPLPLPSVWAERENPALLSEVAPGQWWRRPSDLAPGSLLMVIDVTQRGPLPLALNGFAMTLKPQGGAAVTLDCVPVDGNSLGVLMPASVLRVRCAGIVYSGPTDSAAAGLMQAMSFVAAQPPVFEGRFGVDAMVKRLAALSAQDRQDFASRHADCRNRGSCDKPRQQRNTLPAQMTLALLTAFWLFCGLARRFGTRVASVVTTVLMAGVCFWGSFIASSAVTGLVTGTGANNAWVFGAIVSAFAALLITAAAVPTMVALYRLLFGEDGILTGMYRSWQRRLPRQRP